MVLAFGDHRLDIERRELRCGTEIIDVEPKVFDLLAFLVQQRDRVVSKDDLLRAVWGGRIVSESALTTRINAARKAVGDDGASQRLIRTFTRKGVRFVGDVTVVDRTRASAGETDTSGSGASPAPEISGKPSILVLPFLNMSGDPAQDYFVDGMVEEIITALSHIRWLFVIARSSTFTYKGQTIDVKQIGRELGVRYVLEGSVRICNAANRCADVTNPCGVVHITSTGSLDGPVGWPGQARPISFASAFPFVVTPPSIDSTPLFTRAAVEANQCAPKPIPSQRAEAPPSPPTPPTPSPPVQQQQAPIVVAPGYVAPGYGYVAPYPPHRGGAVVVVGGGSRSCRFSSDCGDPSEYSCRSWRGQQVCMGNGYSGAPCWFMSDCLSNSCDLQSKTCR